jgi:amidohydrolase
MPSSTPWQHIIEAEVPKLIEIRHQIHSHPEIAFEERETSALVLRELQGLELDIRTGLGKGTGILATLKGTAPGADSKNARTVLLRADMDALPITETTGLPYASKIPGKMHACGHDGHTTTLLGTAKVLASQRNRLRGNVVFCFQPAEEGGGGGNIMVKEGALENPKVSVAFALHGQPTIKCGDVGVRPGCSHAASDSFGIVVRGSGGHAAAPHSTVDPIVIGCRLVEALQSIVSREVNPVESAVITVGAIHSGNARNVIPDSLEIIGTIRTLKEDVRRKVHAAVRRTAEGICAAGGARAEIELRDGYPVVNNDVKMAHFLLEVGREVLGEARTQEQQSPSMGGEDFGYFLQQVPGAMFRVGVGTRDNYPPLHNPGFDYTDAAIPVGMLMFCRATERYLAEN